MKKSILASGLVAMMALASTSCDSYDIYPNEYHSVLIIKDGGSSDLTLYVTDETYSYPINVLKGGSDPDVVAKASLRFMNDSDWEEYIEETNNQYYVRVPNEYISFSNEFGANSVTEISAEFNGYNERYHALNLNIDVQNLKAWMEALAADPTTSEKVPVIAIGLYAEDGVSSVYEDGKNILLAPEFANAIVDFDENNVYEYVFSRAEIDKLTETTPYQADVNITFPGELLWDFDVEFQSNKYIIADYNSANGTAYQELPTRFLLDEDGNPTTEIQTTFSFKNGGSQSINIAPTIDLHQFDTSADLNVTYAVPMRLKKKVVFKQDVPDYVSSSVSANAGTKFILFRVEEAALTLSDSNVTANDAEPSEGSIAALFDDNTATFYHSAWSVTPDRDGEFYSYLEIALDEPINACFFQLTNRNNSNPCPPDVVYLFYSNDAETDNPTWTKFAEITGIASKLSGSAATATVGSYSEPFVAPETFTALRFCVVSNSTGNFATASGSVYWNLSEFKMWGMTVDQ
jgi:hypothetical protein